MKVILQLVIIIVLSNSVNAQSAGILDPDFNANGILTFPFSTNDDIGADTKVDGNKKIVVGATSELAGKNCFAIARLNPDGSFDNSFSGDGKELTAFGNDNVGLKKILIQPDNKIIALGVKASDFVMARYNTNGSLDNSFSFDGKVTTAASESFNTAALDKDGNIFVLANQGTLDSQIVIWKYKPDGSLDQSFGTAGKKTVAIALDTRPDFLHIDDDGKMHIAGTYFNAQINSNFLFYTCLTAAGNIDQSVMGSNKFRSAGFAQSASLKAAVKNPDGTFYLAALTNSSLGLVKLSSTGMVIAQFGNGGRVETLMGFKNVQASGILTQPDGKILVGGKAIQQNFVNAMWAARFDANGNPDNTFGTNGVISITFDNNINNEVYSQACVLQPDGRFIVSGTYKKNAGKADVALIRVLTGIQTAAEDVTDVSNFQIRNLLNGEMEITTPHPIHLSIYNITGVQVANFDVTAGSHRLSLPQLSSGIYFISDGSTVFKFFR